MGLFSGIEKLGIMNFESESLFEEEEKKVHSENIIDKKTQMDFEKELMYLSKVTCPVCEKEFTTKRIRGSKLKLMKTDLDLRPIYEGGDPVKYDTICCPRCGYGALSRFHGPLSSVYVKLIKEKISSGFVPRSESDGPYTYEESILRYKICLANATVKRAKASEKAYICLKTAWQLRSYQEEVSAQEDDCGLFETVSKEDLLKEEKEFLKYALEGFLMARTTETPPYCGMDTQVLDYLLAVLALECEDTDTAGRMISTLLSERNLSPRISQRIPELKDRFHELKNKVEGE